MNKNLYATLVLAFASILLTGCLSPVSQSTYCQYVLAKVPHVPVKHRTQKRLMVFQPETVEAYDTKDMAYSKNLFQIAFYSKHRWVETPSQMIQPLVVDTLQRTNHFKAVVTRPYQGNYHYSLKTNIIMMLQDFTSRPAMFRLIISNQLNHGYSGNAYATKLIEVNVPICNPPYGGVLAANQAVQQYLKQLSQFVLRHT